MVHVEVIAQEPHVMGSPEIATAREYIVREARNLGLTVEEQPFEAPDFYGAPGDTVVGVNVMGRLDGTDSTGAILFVAHYDTVDTTPGANDNTTAVASLIESARALQESAPLRNDVIFLFSDGEEPAPRWGTPAFIADHPWFADVGFVVNLEASGRAGASQLVEMSGSESDVISEFTRASSAPVVFSYLTELLEILGDVGTDFGPFKAEGLPGVHFAYIHGSTVYHLPTDSIENVGRASLQHHGEHVLGIARHFGDLDLEAIGEEGGANYFTIAPRLNIRYTDTLALVFAIATAVLAGWTLVSIGNSRESLRSAALMTGVFVAVLLVGAVAWNVIGSARSEMGIVEGYVYAALLSALFVFGASWVCRWRWSGNVLGGLVVFMAVLGVLTALLAPGLSYLFVWPAAIGSLVLLTRRPASTAASVLTVLVVAALQIPWIDFLLQMSTPRPGNTDSQLLPVGGAVFAFVVIGALMVQEAINHGLTAADSFERPT